MKRGILLRGLIVLGAIWGIVWMVSQWMGGLKASSERVESLIEDGAFEDWSLNPGSSGEAEKRKNKLKEISEVLNRLDLRQRQELNEREATYALFFKLSSEEKAYFVDLTFSKAAERLMSAFDQMDESERSAMMERTIRDMTGGKGAKALERMKEEDPEILLRIAEQGFKAYYQSASAETKMAMRPLMDAAGEIVQGFAPPGGGGF
ncbi:hypothetical protein N9A94_06515 [Akkermansiaceae bacterium]|nr:hypothetical protein [Akkermansiaceae bacterium]MDB4538127.1 hypothetical protein [Akkermansiaceae bacterium]